jgi:hypothetical protein
MDDDDGGGSASRATRDADSLGSLSGLRLSSDRRPLRIDLGRSWLEST